VLLLAVRVCICVQSLYFVLLTLMISLYTFVATVLLASAYIYSVLSRTYSRGYSCKSRKSSSRAVVCGAGTAGAATAAAAGAGSATAADDEDVRGLK
jgi:FlaA1/EpsC-like NDP-sugar epimerase